MQIFEFYFNPKARGDRFFEIFSFEPAPSFDGAPSRMTGRTSKGNVYLVGELANALPQNSGLLQKFAKVVSREYELFPDVKSQDAFFRSFLKRANDFFAQELRKGNVDWLGNLHGALLHVKNSGKKSSVMFSKTGGIKVFMTRGTNVVDLGKNIQDSSHGAELFSSVVSVQAFAQDKVVILTKDVYDALTKENALVDLSALSDAKHFQAFLKQRERMLSRLSGLLFAVLMEEFVPQVHPLSFLKRSMFSLKLPKLQLHFSQLLRFPVFKVNKQKVIMIAAFFVLLAGGFLTFQGERKELQREAQTVVLQIQVIQREAQSALELNDARSANILLQEAWKKASSHTGKEIPFRETFVALQKGLEQQLLSINSIQYIEEPLVLVDMESAGVGLIPQKMILAEGTLYFFNPFSSDMFVFDLKEKKGKTISTPGNIQYGIPFLESALFFGVPNLLFFVVPDALPQEFNLQDPSSFGGMAGFEKNLYFFNSQNGTIAKYEDALKGSSVPSQWIAQESFKKPVGAKSMAIDGNIWVLTQSNAIQRYFGGLWQEDIQPLIFPLLKSASLLKIFPGLPYFYLLDPSESRLILLTKSGDLVKQYRMKSPEPLLDFTVSANGNTLYLLSGSRVFQIPQ